MARKKKLSTTVKRAAPAARPSGFDLTGVPPAGRKSPVTLRDWLDLHIPWFVGPHIAALGPNGGQRGAVLSIQGIHLAATRSDNQVTIAGTRVPVLAATATASKVLVTKDVDTGPVKVTVGTRSATTPYPFAVAGDPGTGDDGPPWFSTGAGDATEPADAESNVVALVRWAAVESLRGGPPSR